MMTPFTPRAFSEVAMRSPITAVGIVGGAAEHDDDVAGLALLDGDVEHPVVAGLCQDGDRRACDGAPAQTGRM